MSWSKSYSRIIWENVPSLETPIHAANLNKMDVAINTVDDRVLELESTKAKQSDLLQCVNNIVINDVGIITITYQDGHQVQYDTLLEKIAVNFDFNPSTQKLIITLDDGTTKEVDLSSLITQYEFVDSSTIVFSVNTNGEVSCSVRAGSLTGDYLEENFLANARNAANSASASANSASASAADSLGDAHLAESYAIGNEIYREGSSTDNAKYYKEETKRLLDSGELLISTNPSSEYKQKTGAIWIE